MRALVTDFSIPKLVATSLLGRVDKWLYFVDTHRFVLDDYRRAFLACAEQMLQER